MPAANLYDNYLEGQVLTSSALQLVVLLYRAAIDSLETARERLRSGDVRGRVTASAKAINIVVELTQSLDAERGGDLAQQLAELYAYMLRRIHHANTQLEEGAYTEGIELLRTLLSAWLTLEDPAHPGGHEAQVQHQPLELTF